MSLRKDLEDLDKNGQIGDWCFCKNDMSMFLRWGREVDDLVHLPLNLGDPSQPQRWGWDGNREAPTLSPSINVIGHWHGWLRNGKLETA